MNPPIKAGHCPNKVGLSPKRIKEALSKLINDLNVEYDKKDLQILELLFYSEQGVGFSTIKEATKISKSALARHLDYLYNKVHYVSKVPDEKTRFFVYELTEQGGIEIATVLCEKHGILVYSPDGKKDNIDYKQMKNFLKGRTKLFT